MASGREERRVQTWVPVIVGGALGSAARHAVNLWTVRRFESAVPLATGLVNLIGSALIGILAGLLVGGHLKMGPATRAFVFVGLLGGFTTFSSFGLDTLTLAKGGRVWLAATNVLAQVGLGLLAVFAGYALGVSK
jgi:CrcB protein